MTDTDTKNLETVLLRTIPAKRWFLISKRLDMQVDEIMETTLAIMIVAANERHREQTGKDDFARFLNMGFLDLAEACGLNDDDGESSDESEDDADPKSGDGGRELVEEAGPVLPDHGPAAG